MNEIKPHLTRRDGKWCCAQPIDYTTIARGIGDTPSEAWLALWEFMWAHFPFAPRLTAD